MNYKRIYDQFITDRRAREAGLSGYTELHHIVPRCMGGSNDAENLIRLTAEDHFFAHLLLAKAYGGDLWYALTAMTVVSGGRRMCNGYLARSRKVVAMARAKAAARHSVRMKGVFAGSKHPMYGKPCSELAKQRTRERHAAGLHPMATDVARAKVSAAMKGMVLSQETRKKISESRTGQKDSEETRKKKSDSHVGLKLSAESIEKLSRSLKGKKKSREHVEKMRQANIGKKMPMETRMKISAAWKDRGHPKGMLGKNQSDEFKRMMKQFNADKREYAARFGVSARTVTRAMIEAEQ